MTDRVRRRMLGAALGAPALLAGCSPSNDWRERVQGRWIGDNAPLGHRVRHAAALPPPPGRERRCDVIIVGGGIAGLAAARALRRAGVEDFTLLELEDDAGGNSRGHVLQGLPCPRGAHYLPLPGPAAEEVQAFLVEIGLARAIPGGHAWDERLLCHSPQERLFIDGHWQDGLLPEVARNSPTRAQYHRLAALMDETARLGFSLPTRRAAWSPALAALDAQPFDTWLRRNEITDDRLHAYLDYCCRDDYGAGSRVVSAWAGVHYFASRHGFTAPGDGAADRDPVLTWPDGNAPLARALRAPLGTRLQAGRAVFRIDEGREEVQAWCFAGDTVERWTARHAIIATPLFIAARLLRAPPPALIETARAQRHAPWLVAELLLDGLPLDRVGAPLSWDNVIHGSASLGYVDAQHQSLAPVTGPRLWTAYWALPESQRQGLLEMRWEDAAGLVLSDLHAVHPDLAQRLTRVDCVRHGHAMAIPTPAMRASPALAAVPACARRVSFAHADLAGYSVFEEAFTCGDTSGERTAVALKTLN